MDALCCLLKPGVRLSAIADMFSIATCSVEKENAQMFILIDCEVPAP